MTSTAASADVWNLWQSFNQTESDLPDHGGLLGWLASAAASHPDRPAVRAPDGTLTHRELDERSEAVRGFLVDRGVPPGSTVAVTSARSRHAYPALLGVLKAGCAYVPFSADDPAARLEFILADSEARAVLALPDELVHIDRPARALTIRGVLSSSDQPTDQRADQPPVQPVATGDWTPCRLDPTPCRAAGPPLPHDPERTSYIIYTSGTTGRPKGVRIAEASLLNFLHWFLETHPTGSQDLLAQTAPLTFDPSVQQIFPAWVAGACVVPVPETELHDASAFVSWLARERITHLDLVTSHWRHLWAAAEADVTLRSLPDLRWIIIGGETLHHHESHRWHEIMVTPAVLDNIYGPTEATINATSVFLHPEISQGQAPIGSPMPNYRLYVVDEHNRLCPPGETGELLIAGVGLAQRYQSASATARAFGELGLPDGSVERVYRSGDLARLLDLPPYGWTLEFQGRTDTQVKIRGFRVELEEIQAVAKACPGVRDAAVAVRATPEQLVCWYTTSKAVTDDVLRGHLARHLAAHQLPNLYVPLPEFPVTRNGKLDRAALNATLEDQLDRRTPDGPLPRTPLEQTIADAWSHVLGVGRIGVDEDFFSVGGTSLLAGSVIQRLRAAGLHIPVAAVFKHPTVKGLAGELSAEATG